MGQGPVGGSGLNRLKTNQTHKPTSLSLTLNPVPCCSARHVLPVGHGQRDDPVLEEPHAGPAPRLQRGGAGPERGAAHARQRGRPGQRVLRQRHGPGAGAELHLPRHCGH